MQELIVVWFIKEVPQIANWAIGWKIGMAAMFIIAAVLQLVILGKKNPGWVLPVSFLAGEVCCEIFWQTIAGYDALVFSVGGVGFLMGLLGTIFGNILYMVWRKIRRA